MEKSTSFKKRGLYDHQWRQGDAPLYDLLAATKWKALEATDFFREKGRGLFYY